ncbi:MAG TPA: response regulator [Stellaceae bacterium]|nr:response regulator [Stellaceae bacterium]
MTERQRLILVLEDDPDVCEVLADMLRDAGHDAICTHTVQQALEHLAEAAIDLALIDLLMRGAPSPLEVADRAKQKGAAVVLMSGSPQALEKFANGPYPILAKPFRHLELLQIIERSLSLGGECSERSD